MPHVKTLDGNEAVARVAYALNEVVAIYPITPSSPMGEHADAWSQQGKTNLFGSVPVVQQMQAEGGAAGAVHGSLQTGALTTTFTASQGLLLMIPNLYKIAGEMTPAVVHVAARSVATHALSIFGDHSDVMAARPTGMAQLFAASVQEAHDFALIAQAATLRGRIPFIHVMDGFRTSHEVHRIALLDDADLDALIDRDAITAFRDAALSPTHPVVRGTAQNPDVFFQARERIEPHVRAMPGIVEDVMKAFEARTGRRYRPFDYVGAPDAERVLVVMGSAADTAHETVAWANARGEKVGVLKVRLFRPFDADRLLEALPASVRTLAVMDRTKEPGANGEPLLQDVVAALHEDGFADRPRFERPPHAIGVRYGLSSKEVTPAMLIGLFAEMASERPRARLTLGIEDDLSGSSVAYDPTLDVESDAVARAVFWGLGSDGTVGAAKNTIKIIGEGAGLEAQGAFVYDSKKSGARTISHLRFGPEPIRSAYQIRNAGFVGVHQFGFLERYDVLANVAHGATVLINAPYPAEEVWDHVPAEAQRTLQEREATVWTIDAYALATELDLGPRINTIMQAGYFALSGVLERDEAMDRIADAIRATYGARGEAVVEKNLAAVRAAPDRLARLEVPAGAPTGPAATPTVPADAPAFVREVTAPLIEDRGDDLPVSVMPLDGTWPTGTAKYEKRNLAQEVPVWDPDLCIQCGKCVMVCPHSAIRAKLVGDDELADAPEGFQHAPARFREVDDAHFTLQVAMEDCTGCTLCAQACPAKDKSEAGRKALMMEPQAPRLEAGRAHWDFFVRLPDTPRHDGLSFTTTKNVQLLEPTFEFSGACSGCGETPYVRLVSQLYGDRSVIANATGCSSIYGGNLPTTPWTTNDAGLGPAWSNSLFEDNAEFGMGMRLSIDMQRERARSLMHDERIGADDLLARLDAAEGGEEAQIAEQRAVVADLVARLEGRDDPVAGDLRALADRLVRTDVWILGGDGWAYDIGYGGLDHVLASGEDVNVLVLDTEVYSNTGGQASKATGLGAVAKFAAGGKRSAKKDLARMAMSYQTIYVAQIAMGANDAQTVKALREAEAYPGPSLVIAYAHCIAHGIDMAKGLEQQKKATLSGYWPLFRYDPRRAAEGLNPLQLDSRAPKIPFKEYALQENRYRLLRLTAPRTADAVMEAAQEAVDAHWKELEHLAAEPTPPGVHTPDWVPDAGEDAKEAKA
ncbi:MAG: pyruvate:ferredoxin (flavodoxin) oxidoreductase [Trueperaceae bacterium]|nr:pyruvate:ferredoxin (flavodoxin) oxidoreductase [Trueperaceae bacterium]